MPCTHRVHTLQPRLSLLSPIPDADASLPRVLCASLIACMLSLRRARHDGRANLNAANIVSLRTPRLISMFFCWCDSCRCMTTTISWSVQPAGRVGYFRRGMSGISSRSSIGTCDRRLLSHVFGRFSSRVLHRSIVLPRGLLH